MSLFVGDSTLPLTDFGGGYQMTNLPLHNFMLSYF